MKGKRASNVACLLSLGTGTLPSKPLRNLDVELPKDLAVSSLISNVATTAVALNNLKNIFTEQVSGAFLLVGARINRSTFQLAVSDGQCVERARSWAHSMRAPFYRLTPKLNEECALNTSDDAEIVKMMWSTKVASKKRAHPSRNRLLFSCMPSRAAIKISTN